MRAVLDANVLVSAALSAQGPSAALVRAGGEGVFEIVTSAKLLAEVGGVLRREHLRRYLSLDEVTGYLRALELLTTEMQDPDEVRAICRDPSDDYLVELVEQHGTDVLVSGDKDMISLPPPEVAVHVVSPREALGLIGAI